MTAEEIIERDMAAILTLQRRRIEKCDPELGANCERLIIQHHLMDLATEWLKSGESVPPAKWRYAPRQLPGIREGL